MPEFEVIRAIRISGVPGIDSELHVDVFPDNGK